MVRRSVWAEDEQLPRWDDQYPAPNEPQAAPLRAAQYVRMSTDHQKYSTENQADAILHYAASRGIEIVRTYADAGKSGLKIEGRDALRGHQISGGMQGVTLIEDGR